MMRFIATEYHFGTNAVQTYSKRTKAEVSVSDSGPRRCVFGRVAQRGVALVRSVGDEIRSSLGPEVVET